jgi:DNA invertase Pin-like site-specific DNA recombinase
LSSLEEFRVRGIDFVSLNDSIDTSTPNGRFTFAIIAAVAELEREIIRERVRGGLDAARQRGQQLGRPRAVIDLDEARKLIASGVSVRKAALTLRVGATTLTRALRARPHGDASPGAACTLNN